MTRPTAITKLPFEPDKVPAYPILGEGLWGSVLDLGDGTVVKLARKRCAGIGDGRSKIEREFKTLRALEACGDRQIEITPSAISFGDIPGAVDPNPTLWLHTTMVPGHRLRIREIEQFDPPTVQLIGLSVGTAIANLQCCLDEAIAPKTLLTTTSSLVEAQRDFLDDSQAVQFVAAILARLDRSVDSQQVAIHGDLNISNVLFENNQVRSILDFAETRFGFYEEDLAPIIAEVPILRDPLIRAFETASGCAVRETHLTLALAIYELFTFVINGRLNDAPGRKVSHERLSRMLGM